MVNVEGLIIIVECIMEYLGNGKWRGRFIFKEVGEYKVWVEVGSIFLFGSLFMCKVGDLL